MRDIIAYETENPNKPVRTILAERGEIKTSKDGTEMKVRLFDGSISDAETEGVHTMQFQTYEFPPVDSQDINNMKKKQRDLTLAEIIVMLARKDPPIAKEEVLGLVAAFHNRIAFAFGSFIFVLLGVPVAVLVRRGEIIVSFAISMAGVSLYYVLFAAAKATAMHGVMPTFLALWLPNILLIIAGAYLMRRAILA